jgi:MFS family permease
MKREEPAFGAGRSAWSPPADGPADGAEAMRARVQRRAVPVLAATQVLGGVGVAAGLAVGGLLAEQISDSTARAGLAATMSVLGAALLAVPMARLAQRFGRRVSLTFGYGVGAVGALTCVLAGALDRFGLLLAGALVFGGGTASGLQARYAAVDAASPSRRGRALSVVVWATTVGAVAGPNLSGVGAEVGRGLGVPALTGAFLLAAVAFLAAGAVVTLRLRPDPLSFAVGVAQASRQRVPGLAEVLGVVAVRPRALFAMAAIGTAHAVMVGVMVMAPVHLHHGGASLETVGIVISMHIAGMYAASPLMGFVADRFGATRGIVLGMGLLLAALLLAGSSAGTAHRQIGLALFVLGLGWSACLVSGSTLLTASVPGEVRTAVQGVSDLVMGAAGAAAGAVSGPLLAASGYPALCVVGGCLLVPAAFLGARAATRPQVAEPA